MKAQACSQQLLQTLNSKQLYFPLEDPSSKLKIFIKAVIQPELFTILLFLLLFLLRWLLLLYLELFWHFDLIYKNKINKFSFLKLTLELGYIKVLQFDEIHQQEEMEPKWFKIDEITFNKIWVDDLTWLWKDQVFLCFMEHINH
ncbi:Nudix (Nucleoside diphosphate linked moiety X)-type motif 1 [Paramecium bursaria]